MPAAEPTKLAGRLGDSLPATPLDSPQAPNGFTERYVVERLEVANVESQQVPLAVVVALPAPLAADPEDRAEEIWRKTPCYFAVRVADVDLVAIQQVDGHSVILATDSNQSAVECSSFPERSIRESARLFDARECDDLSSSRFPETRTGAVLAETLYSASRAIGSVRGLNASIAK